MKKEEKQESILLKAGIFVLLFAGGMILASLIIWLVLPGEDRAGFQAFISGFPATATIAMIGAVGVSKWIDKFLAGKRE